MEWEEKREDDRGASIDWVVREISEELRSEEYERIHSATISREEPNRQKEWQVQGKRKLEKVQGEER